MKNALEKIVFSILFLFTLNPVARAVPVYWNLFNFEEESTLDSIYVTYGALDDMLTDSNRTGSFTPGAGGAAQNVVGSGSDGSTYWNLFNFEEESTLDSIYVTYGALDDMLTDSNRTGSFTPGAGGAAQNVVGSGSDGSTYWNLFNFEEESTLDSIYVTYGALDDMLTDSNRTGSFTPGAGGAAQNVIGSGAFVAFQADIPEPSAFALLGCGLAGLLLARRRWKNGSGPDEAGAPISKP